MQPHLPEPPMVSVVITTYNRAHLVGRAIDSVLAQSYANLEIIIVDDGSTDETGAVLSRYCADSRIRIIRHPLNRGSNAAKNTGLDAVTGHYATTVDSDDELLPYAIETLVTTLERLGPAYGMAFGNCVDPVTGELTGQGLTEDGDVTYQDAICGRMQGEFFGIWKSELLEGLRFGESSISSLSTVWHRLYSLCRVRYMHVVMRKYYRDTPGQISEISLDPQKNQRRALGLRAYLDEFQSDIAACCPERLARLYRILALYQTLANDRLAAASSVWQALRYRPSLVHLALLALPILPHAALSPLLRRRFARQS